MSGDGTKARRARTAPQQWQALQTYLHRKYLGQEELARFRRDATNKTGWNAKDIDRWLGGVLREGLIKVADGTSTAVSTAATVAERVGPVGEQQNMSEAIEKWVGAHTEGKVTTVHMKTMKANLRGRMQTSKGVEAMLAMMEAQGAIQIEDRVRGKGGKKRTQWREEALQWAKERGWRTPKAGVCRPQSAPIPRREAVCIELGTGWEGATEGLRSVWDRVVTVDVERQTMETPGKEKSVPDLLTKFETLNSTKDSMIKMVRRKSGIKRKEVGGVWLSPSCKPWSVANHLNDKKEGAKQKRAKAMKAERYGGLKAALTMIVDAREEDETVQYALENPESSAMKRLPEVQALGESIAIRACAYGEVETGKSHVFWMSPETRREFTPIKPTDHASMCDVCKSGGRHRRTKVTSVEERGTRERIVGTDMTKSAAENRVPPKLAEHLGRAMRTAWEKLQSGK